jgi:hypothetical protein
MMVSLLPVPSIGKPFKSVTRNVNNNVTRNVNNNNNESKRKMVILERRQ